MSLYMSYRNLKLHTALNIFVVITLGMIMINGVLAVFWHEHIVRQHLKTVEAHISQGKSEIVNELQENSNIDVINLKIELGVTQFNISQIVYKNFNITFNESDQAKVELLPYSQDSDAIKNLLESANSHLPQFFQDKRYQIIYLNDQEHHNHQPLGIVVDVSKYVEQIWVKEKVILLYILFNAAILTTILFFRFRKTLFIPIDSLLNVANNYQLHEGIWSIQPSQSREFDQLSLAMNAMVERIEKDRDRLVKNLKQLEQANQKLKKAHRETIQAEKLAATGRLAAGFAHEIGNPVTIIQGYLELIQQNQFSEQEKQDFVTRSLVELKRIDTLLFDLMDLAKEKPKNIQLISISSVLVDVLSTLQSTFNQNSITTNHTLDSSAMILADSELIRQVFLNVLLNSIDAIAEKKDRVEGIITCSIETTIISDTNMAQIIIEDNGIGFAGEETEQLFEPFFTTKPIGKGTGLGLSVVHRIIDDLGGYIEVSTVNNSGTAFRIYLPQSITDPNDD